MDHLFDTCQLWNSSIFDVCQSVQQDHLFDLCNVQQFPPLLCGLPTVVDRGTHVFSVLSAFHHKDDIHSQQNVTHNLVASA